MEERQRRVRDPLPRTQVSVSIGTVFGDVKKITVNVRHRTDPHSAPETSGGNPAAFTETFVFATWDIDAVERE